MGDDQPLRDLLAVAQARRRRCWAETCYTHANLTPPSVSADQAAAALTAPSAFTRSSGARPQAALRRFLGTASDGHPPPARTLTPATLQDMLEETVAAALAERVARAVCEREGEEGLEHVILEAQAALVAELGRMPLELQVALLFGAETLRAPTFQTLITLELSGIDSL